MSSGTVKDQNTISGTVKWFDSAKGYGFIVAEDVAQDILLHANVLKNFGRTSVAGNSKVQVVVQETDRGCQATQIVAIDTPETGDGLALMREMLGEDKVAEISENLQPARVKWFDRAKGFGFVNVFQNEEDVFVHMEVLHACGLSDLLPGEAISIRTAHGPRGRMAWDIRGWDHPLDETS